MKKAFSLLLCAFFTVSALSGCGGTDTSDTETAASRGGDTDTASKPQVIEDVEAHVTALLDALAKDYNGSLGYSSTVKDTREFKTIVNIGEDALPYLEAIYGVDGISDYRFDLDPRYALAFEAAYAIKPELFDGLHKSPDGKFAVKRTVSTFSTVYDPFTGVSYAMTLIDTVTGETLIDADGVYMSGENMNTAVNWSPDSKYALFTDCYRGDYSVLYLFDTAKEQFIKLPHAEELAVHLSENYGYTLQGGAEGLLCSFDKWDGDSITAAVVIKDEGSETGTYTGSYKYDISAGTFTVDIKLSE